ncbi:MAG: indole-3-glycerol-phosphate synthase TrpC [Gammaproteobacteria bacterium]|nr:indole-3-glycerol-phosphate synthase TrpC [Gammaproteobacteria bacterium]
MFDFLATMAESSRSRAEATRRRFGVTGLSSRAVSARPAQPLVLSSDGFDLIAEAKLTSPADGPLLTDSDPQGAVVKLARSYAEAGAAAVSVLTEPTRFDGHLEYLEAAASAVGVPMLCKDFLVDPIQVIQARAAGASGVLLIAKMMDSSLLQEMTAVANELGMFALVEIFDERDLELASVVFDAGVFVGVNSRNLTTLDVDSRCLASLAPLLPEHLPWVAESGVRTFADAAAAARLGYRLALVGTALVTSNEPGVTTRAMIAAGRKARRAEPVS